MSGKRFVWIWVALALASAIVTYGTRIVAPVHEMGHILAAVLSGHRVALWGWAMVGIDGASAFVAYAGPLVGTLVPFLFWLWSWVRIMRGMGTKEWKWRGGLVEPVLWGWFASRIYYFPGESVDMVNIPLAAGMSWPQVRIMQGVFIVLWAMLFALSCVCVQYRLRWTSKMLRYRPAS